VPGHLLLEIGAIFELELWQKFEHAPECLANYPPAAELLEDVCRRIAAGVEAQNVLLGRLQRSLTQAFYSSQWEAIGSMSVPFLVEHDLPDDSELLHRLAEWLWNNHQLATRPTH
jgi:hypothetical protein